MAIKVTYTNEKGIRETINFGSEIMKAMDFAESKNIKPKSIVIK